MPTKIATRRGPAVIVKAIRNSNAVITHRIINVRQMSLVLAGGGATSVPPWLSVYGVFAIIVKKRKRLDEVEERKYKDPDQIDKVPV